MKQVLVLTRKFTTMNELIALNRSHWSKGAKIKKEETEEVMWECKLQKLRPFTEPVRIRCKWHYRNILSDPDNYRTQIKSIQDGLVVAGILKDDNLKYIMGYDGDEFIHSTKEGSEITIYNEEEVNIYEKTV